MSEYINNVQINVKVNESNSNKTIKTLGDIENKMDGISKKAKSSSGKIGELSGVLKGELAGAAEGAAGSIGNLGGILGKLGPWGLAAGAVIGGLTSVFKEFGPVVDFVEDSISVLGATFSFVVQKAGEFFGLFEENKSTLSDYTSAAKRANEIQRTLDDSYGINNLKIAESEALIRKYLVQLKNKNLTDTEANNILKQAQIETENIISIKKAEMDLEEQRLKSVLKSEGVTDDQIKQLKEKGLVELEISESAKEDADAYLKLLEKKTNAEGINAVLIERIQNVKDQREINTQTKKLARIEKEKKAVEDAEKEKLRIIEENNIKVENLKISETEKIAEQTNNTIRNIKGFIETNSLLLSQSQIESLNKTIENIKNFSDNSEKLALRRYKKLYNIDDSLTNEQVKNLTKYETSYGDMLESVQEELDNFYSNELDGVTNSFEKMTGINQKLYQTRKEFLKNDYFAIVNTNSKISEDTKKWNDKLLKEDIEKYVALKGNVTEFNKFVQLSANERTEYLKNKELENFSNFQSNLEKTGQATGQVLGNLSQLAKDGSIEQRNLAIASVVASQGIALSNALASAFSPLSPDNIATGGIAAIAKYAGFAGIITSSIVSIKGIMNAYNSSNSNSNGTTSTVTPTSTVPRRKYAYGGILQGPSHKLGGIQTPYGELEGNEIVLNKNVTSNPSARAIASSLNKQFGGVSFDNGNGIIKVELANPQMIQAKISDKRLSKSF
jgi:hypothetical protein